jgi:integrase
MDELKAAEGTGARALEFTILTATRSGEVRGATWPEVDLKEKVWTIPADRTKAGKEHRVPLSPAAVKLLQALPRMANTNMVFPAPRGGTLLDMTLTAVIRRMNKAGDAPRWIDPRDGSNITVHGFRSTFRDWAGEASNFPREVIEHALAHQLRDKAEAAYARGTLFEKQRDLMKDWARFCARTAPATGTVVRMPKRA